MPDCQAVARALGTPSPPYKQDGANDPIGHKFPEPQLKTGSPIQDEDCYTRKVFVGGITPQTTEEMITQTFEEMGAAVEDCVVKRYPYGNARGFAFVIFKHKESVQFACDQSTKVFIAGRRVDIKKARPLGRVHPEWEVDDNGTPVRREGLASQHRVFVGGLPISVTHMDLAAYFSKAVGMISEAQVIHEAETQRSRGFGFVTFADKADADRLCSEQRWKHRIHGKVVECRAAKTQSQLALQHREDFCKSLSPSPHSSHLASVQRKASEERSQYTCPLIDGAQPDGPVYSAREIRAPLAERGFPEPMRMPHGYPEHRREMPSMRQQAPYSAYESQDRSLRSMWQGRRPHPIEPHPLARREMSPPMRMTYRREDDRYRRDPRDMWDPREPPSRMAYRPDSYAYMPPEPRAYDIQNPNYPEPRRMAPIRREHPRPHTRRPMHDDFYQGPRYPEQSRQKYPEPPRPKTDPDQSTRTHKIIIGGLPYEMNEPRNAVRNPRRDSPPPVPKDLLDTSPGKDRRRPEPEPKARTLSAFASEFKSKIEAALKQDEEQARNNADEKSVAESSHSHSASHELKASTQTPTQTSELKNEIEA